MSETTQQNTAQSSENLGAEQSTASAQTSQSSVAQGTQAQITPLPTPPTSADSASFNERADNFLLALPRFANELNAFGTNIEQAADKKVRELLGSNLILNKIEAGVSQNLQKQVFTTKKSWHIFDKVEHNCVYQQVRRDINGEIVERGDVFFDGQRLLCDDSTRQITQIVGANGSFIAQLKDEPKALLVWGANQQGCLGVGNTLAVSIPQKIEFKSEIEEVFAPDGIAKEHNQMSFWVKCKDGTFWAAGDNAWGQLGLGNTTNMSVFTEIELVKGFESLYSVGFDAARFTYFWDKDGLMYVCGSNGCGQLGTGDTEHKAILTRVQTLIGHQGIKSIKAFGNTRNNYTDISYGAAYMANNLVWRVENKSTVTSYLNDYVCFVIMNDGLCFSAGLDFAGRLAHKGSLELKSNTIKSDFAQMFGKDGEALSGVRAFFPSPNATLQYALCENGDLLAFGYNANSLLANTDMALNTAHYPTKIQSGVLDFGYNASTWREGTTRPHHAWWQDSINTLHYVYRATCFMRKDNKIFVKGVGFGDTLASVNLPFGKLEEFKFKFRAWESYFGVVTEKYAFVVDDELYIAENGAEFKRSIPPLI